MNILAQVLLIENSENNIYRLQALASQAAELKKHYLDAGYQERERSYKIKYQHKEYTVICPEFRDDKKGGEPIVIIPEFLVPGRPYPIYVYLYAIDLYSSAPEKGQRMAAEETRKYFGLTSFAHTTLGRALKAFVRNIAEGTNASEEFCAKTPDDPGEKGEDAEQKADSERCDEAKKPGFPTVKSTEALRKRAAQFLRGILIRAAKQQAIATCLELVRRWFKEHQRFLL
ncbi:MAG: hypothetical protein KGZ57_06275 [Dethiobacter sp.]|nr:hypothetical protein [Dethiobacter sp.]